MEYIKKQFKLITTTASTTCDRIASGSTCFIFIPDTTVNYNMKILLKNKLVDVGFFDVVVPDENSM